MNIITGDCIAEMARMDAESVDAIVTDPPYAIAFMGRAWDTHDTPQGFQQWCERWAREALRVAKPGAHLAAFGGSRTYHRLTCGLEDAGWEIRDGVAAWLYASGFPKSLDVSKAIDARLEAERPVVGEWHMPGRGKRAAEGYGLGADHGAVTGPGSPEAAAWVGWGTALKPAWEPIVLARKPLRGTVAANVLAHGTGALNIDGCRVPMSRDVAEAIAQAGGFMRAGYERRPGVSLQLSANPMPTQDAQPHEAGRWPANVVLMCACEKPIRVCIESPYAGNVDKHVAYARAAMADSLRRGEKPLASHLLYTQPGVLRDELPEERALGIEAGLAWGALADASVFYMDHGMSRGMEQGLARATADGRAVLRRWLIEGQQELVSHAMGCPVRILDEQSGERPGGGNIVQARPATNAVLGPIATIPRAAMGDTGGAARFYFCAKASTRERQGAARGRNAHPTVKPLEVMRWLVRLVTPTGGLVLDPFAGSGTTVHAALTEGFRAVGIEQDAAMAAFARERVAGPLFAGGQS